MTILDRYTKLQLNEYLNLIPIRVEAYSLHSLDEDDELTKLVWVEGKGWCVNRSILSILIVLHGTGYSSSTKEHAATIYENITFFPNPENAVAFWEMTNDTSF